MKHRVHPVGPRGPFAVVQEDYGSLQVGTAGQMFVYLPDPVCLCMAVNGMDPVIASANATVIADLLNQQDAAVERAIEYFSKLVK